MFDSINVFRWSQYFPNLVELNMDCCNGATDNLISELTALEYLSRLHLRQIPNLLDVAFTADCVNRFSEFNGVTASLAPAICCFISLKLLGIYSCEKLTDACIINGISKIKTLETFQIFDCKNITENCYESCKLGGGYYEDM